MEQVLAIRRSEDRSIMISISSAVINEKGSWITRIARLQLGLLCVQLAKMQAPDLLVGQLLLLLQRDTRASNLQL